MAPSNPQGDNRGGYTNTNRGGKCPCDITDDFRIVISSILHRVPSRHKAMEVEGAEDGDKGKGLQIDTLSDTEAQGKPKNG